jgi:hypothetical protein
MQGYKHLIECHCVLLQYRDRKDPIYHKFVVFSAVDDTDTVIPAYAQCNNCGTVHKIYDICKSEIIAGKDESSSTEKKEDVCISLPKSLVELFESYNLEVANYQYARFILENKIWDSTIILTSELDGEQHAGKILRFLSAEKFRVEPFVREEFV